MKTDAEGQPEEPVAERVKGIVVFMWSLTSAGPTS